MLSSGSSSLSILFITQPNRFYSTTRAGENIVRPIPFLTPISILTSLLKLDQASAVVEDALYLDGRLEDVAVFALKDDIFGEVVGFVLSCPQSTSQL